MDKIILQSCFFSWPHPYFVAKTCNDKKTQWHLFGWIYKKIARKLPTMFYNHVNPVEPFLLYLKCDKRDKIAKNNFAINVKNGKLFYQCKKWIFKQFCYQWHMQLLLSYHCYSFRFFYLFRIRSYHWLATNRSKTLLSIDSKCPKLSINLK